MFALVRLRRALIVGVVMLVVCKHAAASVPVCVRACFCAVLCALMCVLLISMYGSLCKCVCAHVFVYWQTRRRCSRCRTRFARLQAVGARFFAMHSVVYMAANGHLQIRCSVCPVAGGTTDSFQTHAEDLH